ncbi:MAG: hypothetical protein ACPGU5_05910 [Lishizhenia sp.]
MKRGITALLILIATGFVLGQETKGSFLFGAHANANYGLGKPIELSDFAISQKYFNLNLLPSTGYFLTNKLVVSANLEYALFIRGGDATHDFAPGIFARYYVRPLSRDFNIVTELGYSATNLDPYRDNLRFSFGPSLKLNNRSSIELLLNNNFFESPFSQSMIMQSSFSLGFQYRLGK